MELPKLEKEQEDFFFFLLGGGGTKGYVPAHTTRARNRAHFRQASCRAHLRALEALELFSCSLVQSEPYFVLSIVIFFLWRKKHS